jgi:hypothetical protein
MASVSRTNPVDLSRLYSLVHSIQTNPIIDRVSRTAIEILSSSNFVVRVGCVIVATVVVYEVVSGIFRSLSWILLIVLIAAVFNSFQMSLTG